MRCGQKGMDARSGAQPISRRLRLVSRRPVCGSSRGSPGALSHETAAPRPVPSRTTLRETVAGAHWQAAGRRRRPFLAASRRDGAPSNGFAVARPWGRQTPAGGAFCLRAPLPYSRYCCGRPPKTASHIACVAHAGIYEIGSSLNSSAAFFQRIISLRSGGRPSSSTNLR